jgi:RNA-binding protein YlmH
MESKYGGKKVFTRTAKDSENEEADDDNYEDDDDEVDDDDLSRIVFPEDAELPDSYKELKVMVKSLRLDGMVAAGLRIARNKVDDLFLDSKLRLNGERVLKKSKQMNVGDYVDVVISSTDGSINVKRVRVIKVSDQKTSTDKLKAHLRVWKNPVTVKPTASR